MLCSVIKLTPFIAKFSCILRETPAGCNTFRATDFVSFSFSDGRAAVSSACFLPLGLAASDAAGWKRSSFFSRVQSVSCAQVFALSDLCRSFTVYSE